MSSIDPDELLYWGPGLWAYLEPFVKVVKETLPAGVEDLLWAGKKRRKKGRALRYRAAKADYRTLNGRRLTPTDQRYFNKLKRGKIPWVTLAKIDEICVYYDLALWEALESAGEPVAVQRGEAALPEFIDEAA